MKINHQNKHLIFSEAIACTALSAAPPLVSDITIAVNQIMAARPHHPQWGKLFFMSDTCSYYFTNRQDSATVQRMVQKSKIVGGSGFATDTGNK